MDGGSCIFKKELYTIVCNISFPNPGTLNISSWSSKSFVCNNAFNKASFESILITLLLTFSCFLSSSDKGFPISSLPDNTFVEYLPPTDSCSANTMSFSLQNSATQSLVLFQSSSISFSSNPNAPM